MKSISAFIKYANKGLPENQSAIIIEQWSSKKKGDEVQQNNTETKTRKHQLSKSENKSVSKKNGYKNM
ncbi:hypothetical protein J7438_10070 [Thalassotalea sp. G20_0]|uniref:hypothetical protein n=1 Tax=Thalassotalea sp. G20_0 TaxID=2821093 RepID=UPI001ADC30AC|nr:hypothetical protein [Thalassotalea sp. G20_0]MBO9494429.1 hypothetical protein [Thalassotalea sp. G20_0]